MHLPQVRIVAHSMVTEPIVMPPEGKIWLATFGFGPMAGIACARFSSISDTAIAVISAVIAVPVLRTGRYAMISVPIPTIAQMRMAGITDTQIGRPRAVMIPVIKIIA